MKFPFPLFFAAALGAAASAPAQTNCPMQTTQNVPAAITYGPAQSCAGIDYSIGEVQVTTGRSPCPLFAIVTPAHQLAVPSTTRTLVQVTAHLPVTKITYVCNTRWFLVVPIGTKCVADRQFNVGSVQNLIAKPCPTRI